MQNSLKKTSAFLLRFEFLEDGSTFTEFGDFSDYDLNDDELYSLLNDIVYEDSKDMAPGKHGIIF